MRIVVFGATGNIGQEIVKEAIRRQHEVVGVVRDPSRAEFFDPQYQLVAGDATSPQSVAGVVRGSDAVVSAVSPRPGRSGHPAPSLAAVARSLIQGLRQAGVKRLVVVGGAGTLEVAPGVALMDTPDFPQAWMGEAEEGRESLEVYRTEAGDLDWTFISPAAVIEPGARTGRYRTTRDTLLVDERGRSRITYQDFAIAVLDELEQPRYVKQRFGVAY